MTTDTSLLPSTAVQQLQGEKLVFAVSTNPSGDIYSTAISWLVAVSENVIRFAISPKSRLLQNINEIPSMQILVALPENVLAIEGKAVLKSETIQNVSFPMACVEVSITKADDIMFYGGLVTSEAKYTKTYPKTLSEKLDKHIYAALNNSY
jgi:hypothetical protein